MITSKTALGVASAVSAVLAMQAARAADQPKEYSSVETVVVTAQKFEQSLVDVPLSISVVGSEALERNQAANIQDYVKLVPGLQLTQSTPGFGRVVLRGINTGSVASTVSVYVDETTFGSSSGLVNGAILTGDFDTFDIARIEVLRGPQGTLYGASSLGGVLKYVTNAPKLDAFQVRVRGGMESVDGGDVSYSGAGVVNVPISNTVAVRASGFYRKLGGFIDSIGTAGSDVAKNINDSTVDGGRAALLFQPSEDISIKLSAFLQDIDNGASNIVDSDALTEKTLYGGFTQSQYVPQQQDVRYRVYNATAVFGVGFGDLTSATSYGTLTQDFRDDYTVFLSPTLQAIFHVPNESYNQQITRVKRFTQELRLSSHKNDRFEWLAGAYYTDEKGLIDQHFRAVTPGTLNVIAGLPGLGDGGVSSKYQEYAAFANATIGITERFDLTLGGRYSHNKQSEAEDLTGILVGGHVAIDGDSSEDVFTYSLAPKFKINERVALYARVAKGFRPGGPNVIPLNAPPGTPTSYNSDSIVSYEAGLRGDTGNHSVSFDVAAFHIDWKDIQLFARVNNIGLNTNASHAKSDGVELATTFRPVQGLSLALSGAYTNAKLTADTDLMLVGGRDGDQLPYTPKLSLTVSADYDWSIASGRDAYVGASVSHLDKTPSGFDAAFVAANGRQRFLPSYETVDAHAGIGFGNFSIELFGRNLTNEEGKTSVETGSTPLGQVATGVIRPRSFGLTVTAEF